MSDVETVEPKPPKRAKAAFDAALKEQRDRADHLQSENTTLRREITTLQGHVEGLKREAASRDAGLAALDGMTLAELEAACDRAARAIDTLREARALMGGPPESGRPESSPPPSPEAVPVPRPAPPPIDHPRAKGKVVLSPEEEAQKRHWVRRNRGDGEESTA